MMKIDVNTTTATLIPPRESLTPGAVNAVQLEFTFSDEWNGLAKTCVFSNEIETVPAELQNDITSVPTEVLDEVYRWISVGVSGEDAEGTVIIPTIWCRIGQCIPGASGRFVTIDMLQAYWSKQEIDLHTEGDGSKFLGDDGMYHYVSQGGGDVTHEELDEALALKADKDAFDALSATVDDKADKSEIITVTTGDGTKYLADDGTYKTITGGGDVTHEELDAAIAPLATKDEVSAAVAPLATKTELTTATAGLATTAAMNAALALKADKTELASYAKQYDVNQALATKADKTETQTALAQKADKSEIITVTTGSGTLFLADDGTYKPAAGDPPDLSAYLTKTEAGTTYATKTELADKADASALADYETTAHAEATYATKAELPDTSDMLTKTEASATYATQTELSDYAKQSDIITVTTGDGTQFLADDGTYKRVQTDLSSYLTKTEAEQTYATQTEVANKADKSEIITVTTGTGTLFLADDGTYKPAAGDPPDLSAYLTKAEASTTYETQTNASATYATKTELADYETTAHSEATYATKTELADKADTATVDSALAFKADKTELGDYETSEHAAATYATKTELTEGLAEKADNSAVTALSGVVTGHTAEITALQTGKADKSELPDVSDMLTKTEAEGTYADKLSVLTLENTVDAQGTNIRNLTDTKADKTQIITVTSGTGTLFLADDGTYKPAAGDPPDLSAYLTKTEAASTYTPLTTSIAQAASIANLGTTKADKTEIITVSDGDGSRFLANDGMYKTVHVDPPDLTTYLTKTEAGETYETKADASKVKSLTAAGYGVTLDTNGNANVGGTSISFTGAGLEHKIAVKQTLPSTEDTVTTGEGSGFSFDWLGTGPGYVELKVINPAGAASTVGELITRTYGNEVYAFKQDIVTVTDGDGTKYLADDGTYKTLTIPVVDSTLIPDSPNPVSNAAVVTGFATYGTQIEQLNAQVVANAEAIEGLESSKADRTQLQGYLTKMEASETYETIARASKIKSITAAGHAVTVTDEGLANVGGTKVSRTAETPQIGVSNVSLSVQQILPATEEATTGEGGTLPITYTSTTSGALTEYSNFTIDGVPIATKDDLTAGESPIKSISAGGVDVAPDASGNVALEKAIVVGDAVQVTSGTRFTMSVRETVSNERYGQEFSATFVRDANDKASDCQLYLINRTATPTIPSVLVRVVTYDELTTATTDMATQTWVQEYIASLDANNTGY